MECTLLFTVKCVTAELKGTFQDRYNDTFIVVQTIITQLKTAVKLSKSSF